MGRLWFPFSQPDRQKSGLRVFMLLSAGVDCCQKVTQTRKVVRTSCVAFAQLFVHLYNILWKYHILQKDNLSLYTNWAWAMCWVSVFYYVYITLQCSNLIELSSVCFYDTFPSLQWISGLARKSYLGVSDTVATQESCRDQIASWQADSVVVKGHLLAGSHHSKLP